MDCFSSSTINNEEKQSFVLKEYLNAIYSKYSLSYDLIKVNADLSDYFPEEQDYLMLKSILSDEVILAGGSLIGLIDQSKKQINDYDIFIIANHEENLRKVCATIYNSFNKLEEDYSDCDDPESYNEFCYYPENSSYVVRSKNWIKIDKFQIIFKEFSSIKQVLSNFDFGCCEIAWNGSNVFATPLARFCYERKVIPIPMTEHFLCFKPNRLNKYSDKGFRFAFPFITGNLNPLKLFKIEELDYYTIGYYFSGYDGSELDFSCHKCNIGIKVRINCSNRKELMIETPKFRCKQKCSDPIDIFSCWSLHKSINKIDSWDGQSICIPFEESKNPLDFRFNENDVYDISEESLLTMREILFRRIPKMPSKDKSFSYSIVRRFSKHKWIFLNDGEIRALIWNKLSTINKELTCNSESDEYEFNDAKNIICSKILARYKFFYAYRISKTLPFPMEIIEHILSMLCDCGGTKIL